MILLALAASAMGVEAQTPARPNFLVILVDDQSHDTLTHEFMPFTKSMIADQGISCTNFIVPTSICCPSRASFLTGQYAHNNGVLDNHDPLAGKTIVNQLHDAGYYTGLAGKYLNCWPGDRRAEFDYWAALGSGYTGEEKESGGYFSPRMNIMGTWANIAGHVTYVLREYAIDFLERVPKDKPFFLLYAPRAPHLPAIPPPEDKDLYRDLPKWRPPSFNPAHQDDKPKWLAEKPILKDWEIKRRVDTPYYDELRTLHSLDHTVRDLLLKLKEQGKLDNTVIFYMSDNGLFWGEHRLIHKYRSYEEASRVPFAMRYPPLIKTPRVDSRLVGMIDFAPTICELAGVPPPTAMDGRSLVPFMKNDKVWRDAILIEGWPGTKELPTEEYHATTVVPDHIHTELPHGWQDYRAIRTEDFIYVETVDDKSELYDLKADPFEMKNLIDDPQYAGTIKRLSDRLHHEKL